jgi:hypothetical protein
MMKILFILLLTMSSWVKADEQNPSLFFLTAKYQPPFMQYLKGPEPYLSRPLLGTTASAKSFIHSIARLPLDRDGSPVLGCTGVAQVQEGSLAVSQFKVCIRSLDRVALYRNVELSQSQILAEEKIIRDRMEELKFASPRKAHGEVYWKSGAPAERPVFHPSTPQKAIP